MTLISESQRETIKLLKNKLKPFLVHYVPKRIGELVYCMGIRLDQIHKDTPSNTFRTLKHTLYKSTQVFDQVEYPSTLITLSTKVTLLHKYSSTWPYQIHEYFYHLLTQN